MTSTPLARFANDIRREDDCDNHAEVRRLWMQALRVYRQDDIWAEIHRQDELEEGV